MLSEGRIVLLRAWLQNGGVVVRILYSEPGLHHHPHEQVVGTVSEACEAVRALLEALTSEGTDR
jgi:hypothetical protein